MKTIVLVLFVVLSAILCLGSTENVSMAAEKRSPTVLEMSNIQTASQNDGLTSDNRGGYVPSATDPANFINFCTGKLLTNGRILREASCNGIVMGEIPSARKMISTLITQPSPGQVLPVNKPFIIKFQVTNLAAGSRTNPNSTLYSAPQSLRDDKVVGHPQLTIQSIGDVGTGSTITPDPTKVSFFQAFVDGGDGRGVFTTTVEGGLPEGFYRVCTMVASSNHQPVVMPVVKRGSQDDCQKFRVRAESANP